MVHAYMILAMAMKWIYKKREFSPTKFKYTVLIGASLSEPHSSPEVWCLAVSLCVYGWQIQQSMHAHTLEHVHDACVHNGTHGVCKCASVIAEVVVVRVSSKFDYYFKLVCCIYKKYVFM